MAPRKLDIDFTELFAGQDIQIGSTTVTIKSMSLVKYAVISKKIKGLLKTLKEKNVELGQINTPENIATVAEVFINDFPDVLETITDISAESLKELPIEIIVELLVVSLEVNMKSKDVLTKNFESLVEGFQSLMPPPSEEQDQKE